MESVPTFTCRCKGSSDQVLKEDEDQSVAAKDQLIECYKKMKIKVLLQRIEWSSDTEDQILGFSAVEDDVLVLKMLNKFQ